MTRLFKLLTVLFVIGTTTAPANAAELQIKDLKVGTGKEAVSLAEVTVHYTGWTLDGKKFDSSLDRDAPFVFLLDTGKVIPGWDKGVQGMRVGGKRELIIPPEMAYGKRGAPPSIPANATLKFEVELLAVGDPLFTHVDNDKLKKLMARGIPVVDLRRADEWNSTGIIEGANMITAIDGQGRFQRSFIEDLEKVAGKDDPVILICRTGNRTAAVAGFLSTRMGYTNVYNVKDGITKWIADGEAVVKP